MQAESRTCKMAPTGETQISFFWVEDQEGLSSTSFQANYSSSALVTLRDLPSLVQGQT